MDDPTALLNGDLVEPAEIHQAAGMLTAQLGVSITAALALPRAHAAVTHRPLIDVSRDVIARRLQLPIPPDRSRLTRLGQPAGLPALTQK